MRKEATFDMALQLSAHSLYTTKYINFNFSYCVYELLGYRDDRIPQYILQIAKKFKTPIGSLNTPDHHAYTPPPLTTPSYSALNILCFLYTLYILYLLCFIGFLLFLFFMFFCTHCIYIPPVTPYKHR
jgi:hypothetical protein